jgi:hypothetical protein
MRKLSSKKDQSGAIMPDVNFVNYSQILEDFRAALAGASLINGLSFATKSDGSRSVFGNAQDTDFDYVNMPMADCRIRRADPENTAGQTYYNDIVIEVEIACFDMTSRAKCAKMRDDLTNAVQRFFQQNPHFSAFVDTVQVGAVDFETGETKAQGEFVAAAVAQFHVKLYSEN